MASGPARNASEKNGTQLLRRLGHALLRRMTAQPAEKVAMVDELLDSLAREPQGADAARVRLSAWQELLVSIADGPDDELRAAARHMLLVQLPPEARALVPEFKRREKPVMNSWVYQNEAMTWDIGPDELVLDVGSGGWPFKRANHLADMFPDETTHRVEKLALDGRQFFEVDIERLPFADRAYDFVFCSHVLEHLDNPGQAMRELMRVAPKGYIEVPTRLSDIMFNFTRIPNHHRWHGVRTGNALVLTEWDQRERRQLGDDFYIALQSEYTNPFQDFFERNRDLFFVSYPWNERINFLIIGKDGRILDSSAG